MPDHTTIVDEQIDQNSPVTQPLMFALRDNIEASQWHPYDDGDGVLWDFDEDGSIGTVIGPTFEAGYSYLFTCTRITQGSTTNRFAQWRANYSDGSNSGYNTFSDRDVLNTPLAFSLMILMPSAPIGHVSHFQTYGIRLGQYVADATSATAIVTSVDIRMSEGTFSGGKIILYKKKDGGGLVG